MNRMNNGTTQSSCYMPCNTQQMARRRLEEAPFDLPLGNRTALFKVITEEGFAVYEITLYLDTHPNDTEALAYFQLHSRRFQTAQKEYGRLYGPLTINEATASASETWNWMHQPWPWEGGDC